MRHNSNIAAEQHASVEKKWLKASQGANGNFLRAQEDTQMTTTIIGVIITAMAIELDRMTQYKYYILPLVAFAGLLIILFSIEM